MSLAVLGLLEGIRLTAVVLVQSEPVGPGWYVVSLSAALLICGLFPLYHWYRESKRVRRMKEKREKVGGSSHIGLVIMGLVGLAAYVAVLPILGYLVSTSLFFAFMLWILGERGWIRCGVVSIVLGLGFYFGFVVLGGVKMP